MAIKKKTHAQIVKSYRKPTLKFGKKTNHKEKPVIPIPLDNGRLPNHLSTKDTVKNSAGSYSFSERVRISEREI